MSTRRHDSRDNLSVSALIPGFAPAAPKRNVLVVLAYCFVLLFLFALFL